MMLGAMFTVLKLVFCALCPCSDTPFDLFSM